jgi:hypothetical protein
MGRSTRTTDPTTLRLARVVTGLHGMLREPARAQGS